MNAHTPGPWHILPQVMDADTERHAMACNPYAFRRHIATHPDLDDPECRIVADMRDGPDGDARLISAAPEMLAALERINREIGWITSMGAGPTRDEAIERLHRDHDGILRACVSAIAKARGEA